MLLPIRCKGSGIVPRLGVLAPTNIFDVDRDTLSLILRSPQMLMPEFVDSTSGTTTPLSMRNYNKVFDEYIAANKKSRVEEKGSIDTSSVECTETPTNSNYQHDETHKDITSDNNTPHDVSTETGIELASNDSINQDLKNKYKSSDENRDNEGSEKDKEQSVLESDKVVETVMENKTFNHNISSKNDDSDKKEESVKSDNSDIVVKPHKLNKGNNKYQNQNKSNNN